MTLGDRLVNVAPYPVVKAYQYLLGLRHDALLAAIDRHVRPGDTAVDVGAYRGWYTDRLASRVGKPGRVHSFEPNVAALRVLKSVARRHDNVTIHAVALSDNPGTGQLLRPFSSGRRVDAMGSLSNPVVDAMPHDVVDVPVDTLDHQLEEETGRVTFMKCDVEGHEHEVLLGAQSLIDRHHPVIVMEIEQRHRARPIEETFEWLRGRGYDGSFVTKQGLKPLASFDVARDQTRYVNDSLHAGRPNPAYVSDFIFLPESR